MSVSIIPLHLATCGLTAVSLLPFPNTITFLKKVSLSHCGDDVDPVLGQLLQLSDQLLQRRTRPGVVVAVTFENVRALHDQLQLLEVFEIAEEQEVTFWFLKEISRKRAKNICFRLLIGRSGAGATRNPERKKKNLMTLSSRLMFGLYLRKCCNIV